MHVRDAEGPDALPLEADGQLLLLLPVALEGALAVLRRRGQAEGVRAVAARVAVRGGLATLAGGGGNVGGVLQYAHRSGWPSS